MHQLWITRYGKDANGKIASKRIASLFSTLGAAMDRAERLMENSRFYWGFATSFIVTDEADNVVVKGSIHAGKP